MGVIKKRELNDIYIKKSWPSKQDISNFHQQSIAPYRHTIC